MYVGDSNTLRKMEAFEIKRGRVERQSSSGHHGQNSRITYYLIIAATILVASGILVVLHLIMGYKSLSQGLILLQTSNAEMLQVGHCNQLHCNSKDCVHIASRVLELMNSEADPCQDFYEYACGGYRRMKAVPYAHDSISSSKEAYLELLVDVRKLMEIPVSEKDSQMLKKLKKFYSSCINADLRNEQQNQTLDTLFNDLEFSLDDLQDYSHGEYGSWRRLLSRLEEYRIHTAIKPHFKGSPPNKIEIDCLVPFLQPEVYLDTGIDKHAYYLHLYKEVIDETLKILHMNHPKRQQFISGILEIETKFARAMKESQSPTFPPLPDEYQQQLRQIWFPIMGEAVQEMEIISICKYNLQNILAILNNSPHRMSYNYIIWRLLFEVMQFLGTKFRSLHIHYLSKLPRLEYAFVSKWQECTDVLSKELGLAVAKGLVSGGFIQQDSIDTVKEEFLEVKREFARDFMHNREDEDTSGVFASKLRNMKIIIGYPQILNQSGVLDNVYKDLEFNDNYFSNVLTLKKFKTRHLLNRLWYANADDPVSEISLERSPLGSKSSYDYFTNTANIDFSLLYPPLFHLVKNAPKYVQYGQSSLLARVISHIFYTTGYFYDDDEKRLENTYWSTILEQKYSNFTSCLRHKIGSLRVDHATKEEDDTHILNDAIADIGNFFIAFKGLSSHLKQEIEEKMLPGVPLSKKQTFYVQVAQTFCEQRSKASSDSEAYFRFSTRSRVNKAVSNMNDFGDIFLCPSGSPMNPADKCSLQ